MARSRRSITKLSRREGVNLAETPKVQRYLERRPYPPGEHGRRRGKKASDYAVRLREKQKLRRFYGVSEKQFRNLFAEAASREGATGTLFLQLLESRLDNVVFRLGLARTRRQARQLVGHGHVLVNGKQVDIPSYRIKPGDEITVAERSRRLDILQNNVEEVRRRKPLPWLELDADELKGKFLRPPAREEIPTPVNELRVIEYYSR
jgi:small subunit ribosomal protein S4